MSDQTVPDSVPYLTAWKLAVPLAALLLIALLWVSSGNVPTFLWLNRSFSGLGDTFWSHVTMLGDTAVMLLFLLPFCGRRPQVVWQFLIAGLFAILWTQSMKSPFGVLRPPAVLDLGQIHLIGPLLQHNSFPSGHTTTMFVLAGVICLQRLHYSLKFMFLLMAMLVGASRIACGVHWPMDVLGGALGGWVAALLGNWIGMKWQAGLNRNTQRAIALLLVAVAVWVLARTSVDFAQTQVFQMLLAITALALSLPAIANLFRSRA